MIYEMDLLGGNNANRMWARDKIKYNNECNHFKL